MGSGSTADGRVTKWLRWIARIWSLPIIVYALMMAVGYAWNWATLGTPDPYAVEGTPFAEALPPILMFLGIVGLGIAWRWEGLGGVVNLVFQFATLVVLLVQRPITGDFQRAALPYFLSVVVAIPGILFVLCWRRSRTIPSPQKGA